VSNEENRYEINKNKKIKRDRKKKKEIFKEIEKTAHKKPVRFFSAVDA